MIGVPFFQIDAFAEQPFEGNPAAVCLLTDPLTDTGWAQRVAAEMNLSETAFVSPRDRAGRYGLRWFTPLVEVNLCGHATLAAAHALWQNDGSPGSGDREPLRFATRSGALAAAPVASGGGSRIELDFPARPPESCAPPDGLLEALGIMPRWLGRSGEGDYLLELESSEFVRELQPDLALLATVPARGVIVTAAVNVADEFRLNRDGERPHFVSRFFGPAVGVPEDPVTGSAHCALAPYWSRRLKQSRLLGYQASARGGFVGVEVRGDRVALQGSAITVVAGTLLA